MHEHLPKVKKTQALLENIRHLLPPTGKILQGAIESAIKNTKGDLLSRRQIRLRGKDIAKYIREE